MTPSPDALSEPEERPMTHQFREDGSHYNGGTFFGYGYRAIGEPRLKMVRRWYRQRARRGQTEDRFFVDGARVQDYAGAVEALKTPPVLLPEEVPFLALITDEPAPRPSGDVGTFFNLREKGFVKTADRLWSLTEAGREALQQRRPS